MVNTLVSSASLRGARRKFFNAGQVYFWPVEEALVASRERPDRSFSPGGRSEENYNKISRVAEWVGNQS